MNTKISKVNAFKLTKKIRDAAKLLANRAEEYAKSLTKGELAEAGKLISNTWDLFAETGGSKVQFAIRLDSSCPTHRDKNSKDSDGKKGYADHPMYNAIRHATTRAVSSGKSATKIGPTHEEGTYTKLYMEQVQRFPSYTPEQFGNDLTATGTLKEKVITKIVGYCQAKYDAAVSHGDITLPPSPEEIAAEEAEIEQELEETGT